MTVHEFTDKALLILRKQFDALKESCTKAQLEWLRLSFDACEYRWIWGQPSQERTCYEKNGKHYLRTYNSHVQVNGEYYDAYHLWELDGDELNYLGGLHR